jgi:general secretion pathway protein G
MTRHNPPPLRRAFTLVELLAVIVIIGVLAAILIPTVSKVRSAARATQCTSNLRQLGIATQLYLGEHKDIFYPHTDFNYWGTGYHRWFDYLRPYIAAKIPVQGGVARASLYCPDIINAWPTDNLRTGYGKNGNLGATTGGAWPDRARRVTDAHPPSRVVVMWDDVQQTNYDGGWPTSTWGNGGSWYKLAFRHNNKAHLLLLDGHIASVSKGKEGHAVDFPDFVWDPVSYPFASMPQPD